LIRIMHLIELFLVVFISTSAPSIPGRYALGLLETFRSKVRQTRHKIWWCAGLEEFRLTNVSCLLWIMHSIEDLLGDFISTSAPSIPGRYALGILGKSAGFEKETTEQKLLVITRRRRLFVIFCVSRRTLSGDFLFDRHCQRSRGDI
jgi:hypothetical protein